MGKCPSGSHERAMAKAKHAAKATKSVKGASGTTKAKAGKPAKVPAKGSVKRAEKASAKAPAKAAAKAAEKAPAKGSAKRAKGAPAANRSPAPKGDGPAATGAEPRSRMGVRGAAPWAARHAAKHAAEARARAAEPPPPGSARATLRTPVNATDIKERVAELHRRLLDLKALKRNVGKNFFPLGVILQEIDARRLYEAKGFAAFDSFLERETELGRTVGLRLVRIVKTFQQAAAESHGLDRLTLALAALDAVDVPGPPPSRAETLVPATKVPPAPLSSTTALPLKPPGRH